MIRIIGILCIVVVSCSTQHIDTRSKKSDTELDKLKAQVLDLQGTVTQINNFVASDFTNCSTGLPDFETKICQIAQTATAEQQVIFSGQLQQVVKIFQTEIYGDDCINSVDPGCPVAGSILAEIDANDSQVSQNTNDIAQLQADVLQLQADLASINSRLNDFNGSGSSIEVVISGIEADILALESRIEAIEQIVNNGDVYRTYFICGDISNSGPVYEPILGTGDQLKFYGYINTGSQNGMGEIAEAGMSGDQYLETESNTKKCKFKIYDLTTSLKLCWKNTDRSANSAAIDTSCDSNNSFANPLVSCTCAN